MHRQIKLLSSLAGQYEYRPEPFQLSGSGTSHEYLDCRAALSHPDILAMAVSEIYASLDSRVQAVGGLTLGADPLSVGTSLASRSGPGIRWFSVRKSPKQHGTNRLIEGSVQPGDHVAILDDVATSGASVIQALEACLDFGLIPVQVICLVDRGGIEEIRRWAAIHCPTSAQFVTSVFQFSDIRQVGRARQIALTSHGAQQYGDKPYRVHLEHVVKILEDVIPDRAPYAATILAAGWLHDTLEDTDLTADQLSQSLPESVCAIVSACTDGEGQNRRERKERPFQLIPHTRSAIVVKLADRLANVETCLADDSTDTFSVGRKSGLLSMYRKEHIEFRKRLEGSPADFSVSHMWHTLERLLSQSSAR